ncbi:hypothetical protein [Legionella quateirensis]|uniref:Uncharacterized protein n=1 Tax=Legionella quateirensis TaxID=45072 RepID=A0A378KU56_9GAMM|nr:hypothetical protein [Legionella quateirensis]KTD48316.1 hypothetical protein Lqua_1845 [Legionella quateirensis]STY18354.1 Uncharacterised protein [Legionella quateirensis]
MHNLPKELYHSQVVGKMSFIVSRLEDIDPEHVYQEIRDDYKEELHWIKNVKDFNTIIQASKSGQCPDFDTLSKKALVIQELDRFVTLIKPFTMKKEVVVSMHEKMKHHPNLWSSTYHHRLNELEQLNNSMANLPKSIKNFVNAIVTNLKIHLAENGLSDEDPIANELFKLSTSMRDLGHTDLNHLISLFINYMRTHSDSQPFKRVLSQEEQSQMVSALLAHRTTELNSKILKAKLHDLAASSALDKELLENIDKLFKQDNELKALSEMQLGKHKVYIFQVEEFFSKASQQSDINSIQHTEKLCKLFLLSKAFPEAKGYIEVAMEQSPDKLDALISSPDFLHQIIIDVVYSKCPGQDELESQTRDQLCTQLYDQLTQLNLNPSSKSTQQLYQLINVQVKNVLDGMPQRKTQLETLGFGIPTFSTIEEIINRLDPNKDHKVNLAVVEFYTAIQKAKETHFYLENEPLIGKQIEQINAKDFNAFFNECCAAGKNAVKQLEGNQSGITVIVDILKSIANWGIYMFSLGTSPQFFKKPRTAVDDVVQAVNDLRETLADTLKHIDFSQEPNQSMDCTI